VGAVNLVLLVAGIALIVVGAVRARGPWRRYQALKEQQANLARYESWRGGIRASGDDRTGADVMIEELRRQAQIGGAIVGAGFVLVVIAFVLKA
jgi:hypothetical protein